ncbi:MAG: hypothetical protein JWM10_5363 [Myxococcaceae bacterium]|nr:hypothetical protein [Myxococcaceae bacterium]
MSHRIARYLVPTALLLACADDPAAPSADAAVDAAARDVAVDLPPEVSTTPGLARALTITDVALFQAVRVPLFAAGEEVAMRALPVVADREAVVRVYVRPEAGFVGAGVDGELTVRRGDEGTVVRARIAVARASRDESDGTVFQFALPAAAVGPDTRLSLRLLAPGGDEVGRGQASGARFPADGSEYALRAEEDGGIDVLIVPLRWDVDGSGRLPALSDEQLDGMRAQMRALYPLSEVRLSVHAPVGWSRTLLASGSIDFGAALSALRALRLSEGAPVNLYYYGMVQPTEFFDEYCKGPCTLGQGFISITASDRSGRIAAGLGYLGNRAAETFAHELGHNHGRAHAPCGGAAGPDLAFPYRGGVIGGWGYDERRRAMVRPGSFDFMGYCEPRWISDYNYGALWDRIRAVNRMPVAVDFAAPSPAVGAVTRHRVFRFDGGAMAEWLDAVDLPTVFAGRATVRWLDAGGRAIATVPAQVDDLGDSDEAHALVPPPPPAARSMELIVAGRARRASLPARW